MSGAGTKTSVGYTAEEVCDLAGVTYRMLDWWIRTGLVPTEAVGSGWARTFDDDDVRLVRTIAHLRELGFELEAIREGVAGNWTSWVDAKIAGLMAAFPSSGRVEIREAERLFPAGAKGAGR